MKGSIFAAVITLFLSFGAGASCAQEWTGPYIGGHIGVAFQPKDDSETLRFDTDLDTDFAEAVTTISGANAFSPGFCGGSALTPIPSGGCADDENGIDAGVRGGYDLQLSRFVLGVVGELSFPEISDSVSGFSTTPAFYTLTRDTEWMGALRGRAGFAIDRTLIYGTGGWVRSEVEHEFTTSNVVNTFTNVDETGVWGYQIGGGLERRVGEKLSIGGEYLFNYFDDKDEFTVRAQGPAPLLNPFLLTNSSGTDIRRSEQFKFHTLRFTVSYRF